MTSIDICKSGKNTWEEIFRRVNKALVFLDDAAAEALHWNGGPMMLFNNGALNIKQFSSFESGTENEKKVLFVLGGPLKGQNSAVMQDILSESHFQYVIVYSGLSPGMHTLVQYGAMEEEMKAFHTYEELLLEWMRNMNYTSEIYSLPTLTAPISPHLFVLPEHTNFIPLLPSDIYKIHKLHTEHEISESSRGIAYTDLPREAQLQYKLLVCSINSALEQWGIAEDIYCIGPTSKMLASELASLSWAKARRKAGKYKASLLLVDRTLDMASVCGHHTETLMDRIIRSLPKLEGHENDVKVNMAPLCSVPSNADGVIVPGCLGHPSDQAASNLLHSLVTSKYKEALMEVNRQIVEAASSCALPLKLTGKPGRITAEQIKSTLQLFKGKAGPVRRHCGLLQVAQAVLETLQHPSGSRQDSLLGVEKGLVQGLGDAQNGELLSQLTQTVTRESDRPASERPYGLEDIFVLLVYVYSLAESSALDDPEKERILMSALCATILEAKDDELPDFLSELIGEGMSENKITEALEEIFTKLKALSEAREHLKQFRSTYDSGDVISPGTLKPLLKQLMEAILDPTKPELPDVEYISTGFRDLLKSGFGLFRNVSKPRPNDQPILIVFVVGGVTATEVRLIKETVGKANLQVIVGSTCLLRPRDVLHRLFTQDNVHPATTVL